MAHINFRNRIYHILFVHEIIIARLLFNTSVPAQAHLNLAYYWQGVDEYVHDDNRS